MKIKIHEEHNGYTIDYNFKNVSNIWIDKCICVKLCDKREWVFNTNNCKVIIKK